jgi:hypothetical protein
MPITKMAPPTPLHQSLLESLGLGFSRIIMIDPPGAPSGSIFVTTPSARNAGASNPNSNMADNTPPVPFKYDVIPARIPLKVMTSNLKTAGNGVFAVEAVKAGELIFCVRQPLLNIVSIFLYCLKPHKGY